MNLGIYWCDTCQHPVKVSGPTSCPACNARLRYLTTDIRPVFARERRILQFYGYGPLTTEAVWRSSKSRYYTINGQSVALPLAEQLKDDLPAIANYLNDSHHYDRLDEQLIQGYRRQLEINRAHLLDLEDEAFQFIQHAVKRFSNRTLMVSFSGGKDSTVVSDLVRRGLGRSDILHVFGDTTLEDEHTYDYVRQFQEESQRRSHYHKITWNDPDRLGPVVSVDQDAELNGVTVGAKIGQQATASPIIDWTEFDVWLYLLSHRVLFNKSYRLGYSRVGCWLCPLNSEWSEMLANIFFPEDAQRWRAQLVDFARRIGKPDPEEYIDERGWVKRFGGAGLPNRFSGLEAKPCGDMDNTIQVEVERPVNVELEEFLKPLGKINRDRSRPALGEIYLEGRPNQDWDALIMRHPFWLDGVFGG